MSTEIIINLVYVASAVLFIFGLPFHGIEHINGATGGGKFREFVAKHLILSDNILGQYSSYETEKTCRFITARFGLR